MTWILDPAHYGPAVFELLSGNRLPDLGPGKPNVVAQPALQKLVDDDVFTNRPFHDEDMARCCLAALWLYHDFLDESHAISQEIPTPTGSYWHALMHCSIRSCDHIGRQKFPVKKNPLRSVGPKRGKPQPISGQVCMTYSENRVGRIAPRFPRPRKNRSLSPRMLFDADA